MGNVTSSSNSDGNDGIYRVGFEDVQFVLKNGTTPSLYSHPTGGYILINTLPAHQQSCLIPKTTPVQEEESVMNQLLQNGRNYEIPIILYGKNAADDSVVRKYKQLIQLGFTHVFVYTGGMFEWLLLQDIFGQDQFPTTCRELDILKYRPSRRLGIPLLK